MGTSLVQAFSLVVAVHAIVSLVDSSAQLPGLGGRGGDGVRSRSKRVLQTCRPRLSM